LANVAVRGAKLGVHGRSRKVTDVIVWPGRADSSKDFINRHSVSQCYFERPPSEESRLGKPAPLIPSIYSPESITLMQTDGTPGTFHPWKCNL
jgi:hypothetical protein